MSLLESSYSNCSSQMQATIFYTASLIMTLVISLTCCFTENNHMIAVIALLSTTTGVAVLAYLHRKEKQRSTSTLRPGDNTSHSPHSHDNESSDDQPDQVLSEVNEAPKTPTSSIATHSETTSKRLGYLLPSISWVLRGYSSSFQSTMPW